MMRRFLRRNRAEVVFGAALVVVATAFAAVGMAGSIGNNTNPPGTLDTYGNFSIIDTNKPATVAGQVTKIDYYAGATLPMAFMVVSGSSGSGFTVKYISDNFTPGGTGVQTFTPPPTWMVSPGDNIGMYFASTGVVPFTGGGTPASWEPNNSGKPTAGEILGLEAIVSNRTYSFLATVLEPTTTCTVPAKGYTGWAPVQSLFVPANDSDGVMGTAFTNGIGYKVEAGGFWYAQSGPQYPADAEFSLAVGGSTWTDAVPGFDNTNNDLLDLRINGAFIAWAASFAPDHVYTHDIVGTGAPVNFGFGVDEDGLEGWFADNTGGLCVSVFKDAMAPVVGDVSVSSNAAGSVTLIARADDTSKGGSDIASAHYSLNGGTTWLPMLATDGTFDEPTEDVKATFAGPAEGTSWSVCVKATDLAGNTSAPVCTSLTTLVEASGAIAKGYATYGEKGVPDFALEAYVYKFGDVLGGAVTVNYKLLYETCTFTPGVGTFDYQASPLMVASIRNWTNSCGGTVTMQFLDRDSTWSVLSGFVHPRGAIWVDASVDKYDVNSGDPNATPRYGWVPVDRGNVHTEGT